MPPRPEGPSLLIRGARVGGELADVHCAEGVVTHIGRGPSGADVVLDADGGALLPGLHDHHVHLFALAAARRSVELGPPTVSDPASFDRAVGAARPDADGWVRGVGFHESVAGPLGRDRLDALVPGARVRVQHRTGAMWVLSSAALAATGFADLDDPGVERDAAGRPTGRLYRLDAVLRARLDATVTGDLADIGRELSSYGVTGVCDMTPTEDPGDVEALAGAVATGALPFHVVVTGGPGLPDGGGTALPRGPVKFVLDDARLPSIDALVTGFGVARRAGRPIAVHCVTRAELVVALAAWDEVGAEPGDRIEHGAVIPVELVADLRSRGLVVVTQPSFVATRGDQYLADVDPGDVDHLWRCGSLVEAGVGVAAGTDAPFGDADPWRAIAAARDRTTPSGVVLGAEERITAERALAMFLTPLDDPAGTPRRVEVGAPADLCLLATPLPDALADPAATTVTATIHRGAVHG